MSLYKRPDSKFWWVRFQINGKEFNKSTGETDKKRARIVEQEFRIEATKNPPINLTKETTLAHVIALDVRRAETARKDVGEQTVTTLKIAWKHLAKFFGIDSHPRAVTPATVRQYLEHRRTAGVRGQTIRREIQALRRGLKLAQQEGWIKSVPEPWPQVKRDPKDEQRRGKVHPLPILLAYLEEVRRRSDDAADEFCLALFTGLRAGELKRLQEDWVVTAPPDSATGAIIKLPAWATKDREERIVGCPDIALEIIRRRAQKVAAGTPLLFAGKHRTVYRSAAAAIGRRFNYTARITLRDCRHTFATLADKLTNDRKAVQDLLGHSSPAITEMYLHSDVARVTRASQSVAEWWQTAEVGTGIPVRSIPNNFKEPENSNNNAALYGRGERIRTSDPLTPSPIPIDDQTTFASNIADQSSTQDTEEAEFTVATWYSPTVQLGSFTFPWTDPDGKLRDDIDN